MTPLDLTQCPPPEGMEWHDDGCGGFIAQVPNRTLIIDPEAEERIRVSAWNVDDNVHLYDNGADLPTAYLRALAAVGLAADPEKEALRADLAAALRERDDARAQLAAAPVVLREWPKTAEEAPGEWFFCIHGDCAPRGAFATRDGYALPIFVDESGGSLWVSGEMKPGEFFVRVP